MSIHLPPNSVSINNVRQEIYKTSWLNTVYPNIPTFNKMDIPYITSSNVNTNGLMGLNPEDGTFKYNQFYGWNSWRKPLIKKLRMHQYSYKQGVRLHWSVYMGDAYRTGWAIYRSTDGDIYSLRGIVRYGSEYSNNINIYWTQSNSGRKLVGLNGEGDANWYLKDDWGDHEFQDPDINLVADPTSGDINPVVQFAMVDWGATEGSYWYYVVPIDGRQFHEMNNINNPTEYNINNPTSVDNYEQGFRYDYSVPMNSIFRSSSGDDKYEIIVKNGWDSIELEASTNSIIAKIINYFNYFLQSSTSEVWVGYIEGGVGDNFTWNKNNVLNGRTWVETSIQPNTTYKIAVTPIIDSTSSASQPTSTELDEKMEDTITTPESSEQLSTPILNNVTFLEMSDMFITHARYSFEWSNHTTSASYEFRYKNLFGDWVGPIGIYNIPSNGYYGEGNIIGNRIINRTFQIRAINNQGTSNWSNELQES